MRKPFGVCFISNFLNHIGILGIKFSSEEVYSIANHCFGVKSNKNNVFIKMYTNLYVNFSSSVSSVRLFLLFKQFWCWIDDVVGVFMLDHEHHRHPRPNIEPAQSFNAMRYRDCGKRDLEFDQIKLEQICTPFME